MKKEHLLKICKKGGCKRRLEWHFAFIWSGICYFYQEKSQVILKRDVCGNYGMEISE